MAGRRGARGAIRRVASLAASLPWLASVVACVRPAEPAVEPGPDSVTEPELEPTPTRPDAEALAIGDLYWASGVDGKSVVDIIDVLDAAGDVDPVQALAEQHDHADGLDRALPADAVLPDGFALGDAWTLATPTGQARTTAVAFGAMGGASELHFVVVLDGEHTGLAARASAWQGPVPILQAASPIDLEAGPGKALLAAIEPKVIELAEADAAAVLRAEPLTADRVVAVPGRFPRGFTHLVAIRVPVGADEVADDHVAALLLADATGRVEPVLAPRMTIDSYDIRFLVDLWGDGIDDVIYDSSYYEGSYVVLLAWELDGGTRHRALTGDGA